MIDRSLRGAESRFLAVLGAWGCLFLMVFAGFAMVIGRFPGIPASFVFGIRLVVLWQSGFYIRRARTEAAGDAL